MNENFLKLSFLVKIKYYTRNIILKNIEELKIPHTKITLILMKKIYQ